MTDIEDKGAEKGPESYFFVGYDPGTTAAVALVDLEGRLVGAKSGRGITHAELIGFLIEKGKPILIASDVAICPHAVYKMSARLGVETFSPANDLPLALKRKYSDLKSAHERDAEAAARHAYRCFAGKIRNLRKKYLWSEVAHKLMGVIEQEEKKPSVPRKKSDVKRLLARIKQLEGEKATIRETLARTEASTQELRKRFESIEKGTAERIEKARDEAYRDKLVEDKKKQISALLGRLDERETYANRLKNRISGLKTLYGLAIMGETPVKCLPALNEEEIKNLDDGLGIAAGDTVWIERPGSASAARILAEKGVRAVICDGLSAEVKEVFRAGKVCILDPKTTKIRKEGAFSVLEKKDVEKENSSVEDLLEEYRRSRRIY